MTSLRGQSRREFSAAVRRAAFRRCCRDGLPYCENCGIELKAGNICFEHLDADGLGGEPTLENCGVWCLSSCSSVKTITEDNPVMAKADRVLRKTYGLRPKGRPMPGSRASGLRKRMDGTVERRQ